MSEMNDSLFRHVTNAEAAAALANKVTDWRHPDAAQFALYDQLYEKYSALYDRLEPLF